MKQLKTLGLMFGAFLLMGNESCEKQAEAPVKKRELKRIVEVDLISSPQIDMPGGQRFDFQFVLNQQIFPVLQQSEGFAFRYRPPFQESLSEMGSSVEFSRMNISDNDQSLLVRTFNSSRVPIIKPSDDISCFVNLPQYSLAGSVNSFELLSKVGLGLGFTRAGSYGTGGLGLNFNVETYQLDINMFANHPMTAENYSAVNVTSKQTRTQLDFSLPISNLLLDPSFYFQTPLARVSYNALNTAIKKIHEDILKQDWHTRVLYAEEHVATILGGKNHNLQKGDVLNIYHEKALWQSNNGQAPVPCESQLKGVLDGEPVATVKLFDVSEDVSAGRVEWTSGVPIKMGAKVKVNTLVDTVPPSTPNLKTK